MAPLRWCKGYNADRGTFPHLKFGIGLHSGPITLGIIGDPDHMQFGVVGDCVNTTFRIENLCKFYGATLLLSQETLSRVHKPHRFSTRSLGLVELRGKSGGD